MACRKCYRMFSIRHRMEGLGLRYLSYISKSHAGSRLSGCHGFFCDFVPVSEEPLQFSSNKPSGETASENAQWQFVDDAILKPTGTWAVGRHYVGVVPSFEWARDLDVAKLTIFDVITVPEDPANAKGSEANTKNSTISVANSGSSLLDFHRLPRRR